MLKKHVLHLDLIILVFLFSDDHSRVVLSKPSNVSGSDYVNASSIVSHKSRMLICYMFRFYYFVPEEVLSKLNS